MIAAFYISIPCSYQMNEITKTFKHFFFQRSSDWDKLPPVHKENENYESNCNTPVWFHVVHLFMMLVHVNDMFLLIIVYSYCVFVSLVLHVFIKPTIFFFYVHYLFTHTQHTCTHIHIYLTEWLIG